MTQFFHSVFFSHSRYISTIENDRDLEDYLKTLLDVNNSKHRAFIEKFKILKRSSENKNDNDGDKSKGGVKKKKKGIEGTKSDNKIMSDGNVVESDNGKVNSK